MRQPVITIPSQEIARLLQAIDQPARLDILQVISDGEACVCHLEAALGQRQAYISQHLMALREAGIITSRRAGRYVFYRLKDPRLLELIRLASSQASSLAGTPPTAPAVSNPVQSCPCPHCTTAARIDLQTEPEAHP